MNELNSDPMAEIDAMKKMAEALEQLESGARNRVLAWARERYSPQAVSLAHHSLPPENNLTEEMLESSSDFEFDSAAALLAAGDPKTEAEKALLVAYWFQEIEGIPDLESQSINTELKHQGHGLSNVTRVFDSLIKQRPQLVIQTRKSGNSKQARKKYKLTTAGIQKVEKMLAQPRSGDYE